MAGKVRETTVTGRELKINQSEGDRNHNDAVKCKNKFFKHRQNWKNSGGSTCKSNLQELFMMQGSCKKWIDRSTKEIIMAYSLDNNAFTVDHKAQQPSLSSSSSSSTENDKQKRKDADSKCQFMILNSPFSRTSPKVTKITRMSGPRPKTIRKKMEMEMKLAEKCKRKCKISEAMTTCLRSSKRTCIPK